ncbi:MAG: alpha/beta fold hydrolase, partial [Pedobacter sp.]
LVDIDSKDESNIKAVIDIPQQKAKGLMLNNIQYKAPKLHLELPISSDIKAELDGELIDNTITGKFSQNGLNGTFSLIKIASVKAEKLPYREENVSFKHGDVNLAGTLTLPEKKGNYPAVLLITGSGPQDRNEDIFGFKIFQIIADHLTRQGIAVLRVDDRGVGQSKGGNTTQATTLDYVKDAKAGVEFLLKHSEINKNKIGLLGHSEGGIIAPLLAQQTKDVSFMVLMSGPSETGKKILADQSKLISIANELSEQEINKNQLFQQKYFNALETNTGWNEIKQELKTQIIESINKLPVQAKAQIKDLNEYAETTATQTLKNMTSEWFKFFINYDPLPVLKKTTIPTLAIFGEKDLQVPAKSNSELMNSALREAGNKNYMIKIFPYA